MTAPRVLLTRPAEESAALARQLTEMGWHPVIAPVIAIDTRPVTLPSDPIDAILVTSAHGTTALTDADRVRLGGKPLLAVGAASAAAARRSGFKDVRIADGDAEALSDLVRLTLPPRSRLLYLAGHVRKPMLTTALRRDGHDVVTVETYEAVASAWHSDIINTLRDDPPFACLHFSRRSADLVLAEVARWDLANRLARSVHVCLSPDVALPLRASGGAPVCVADEPTTTSLLQALSAMLPRD